MDRDVGDPQDFSHLSLGHARLLPGGLYPDAEIVAVVTHKGDPAYRGAQGKIVAWALT